MKLLVLVICVLVEMVRGVIIEDYVFLGWDK